MITIKKKNTFSSSIFVWRLIHEVFHVFFCAAFARHRSACFSQFMTLVGQKREEIVMCASGWSSFVKMTAD